jgi:hypothetical protein
MRLEGEMKIDFIHTRYVSTKSTRSDSDGGRMRKRRKKAIV